MLGLDSETAQLETINGKVDVEDLTFLEQRKTQKNF